MIENHENCTVNSRLTYEPPQTVAIEEDPLDSKTSEVSLMVNG